MSNSHNISMTIADMQIELRSPLSSAELGIDERLSPFFGSHQNASRRIAIEWKEIEEVSLPPGEPVYDPGSIWKMYRDKDTWCAEINYADRNLPKTDDDMLSLLSANPEWDNLVLAEKRNGTHWQSALGFGAGELLVRTGILLSGGVVMHASGLDDNGSGIVFVGHSGAGKSTQLGLWQKEPGVIGLNDDRIAVKTGSSGRSICYGTPWGGSSEIATNHSAPLKALILLVQAPENRIERLSSSAAASMLACRTFLPYWDKTLMKLAFENLNRILQSTPVYMLRCRPEREVIPIVRSVL